MDAKERLRLYLEQRRDAGESELVLDSLSVEDVMRLLGAAGSARATPGESRAQRDTSSASTGARDATRPPSGERPEESSQGATSSGDWRAALRAIDAGASPAGSAPTSQAGRSPGEGRPSLPRSDAERAPAPTPKSQATRPANDDAEAHDATSAGSGRDTSSGAAESPASATGSTGGASRDTSHATMPLANVPTGLVVGSPAHELFGGEPSALSSLDDVAAATRGCQLCTLYRTAKQAVPGHGNPDADLVCVGEAPGANEDEQGLPFVGQAGQLLTKILAAIDLSRDDVFICNVLKHRPPGNRNPLPEEVAACSPYLVRQIELLQPRVIVALGTFAAQTLLQTKEPIGRLRGKIHRYYGVPLIVTYHPAALLRNPSWKRPTWEDVQLARRLLDRARGA